MLMKDMRFRPAGSLFSLPFHHKTVDFKPELNFINSLTYLDCSYLVESPVPGNFFCDPESHFVLLGDGISDLAGAWYYSNAKTKSDVGLFRQKFSNERRKYLELKYMRSNLTQQSQHFSLEGEVEYYKKPPRLLY